MRTTLAVLFLACGSPDAPPAEPPPPLEVPNLANARTTTDVRAWMGPLCATRENPALPLGVDWLYCVERRLDDAGRPAWKLAACAPGCLVLEVHFIMDRYLGETAPPL
jgi:hypothetical protein